MKALFNRMMNRHQDRNFATAKAILRGCPPYMFKENWK